MKKINVFPLSVKARPSGFGMVYPETIRIMTDILREDGKDEWYINKCVLFYMYLSANSSFNYPVRKFNLYKICDQVFGDSGDSYISGLRLLKEMYDFLYNDDYIDQISMEYPVYEIEMFAKKYEHPEKKVLNEVVAD